MADDEKDVKPAETITVTVKDQSTGEKVHFKVKKSTKMSKIFDAYAQRRAIARNAFRLLFDGNRIKDDDSPETLQLEATDEIEAVLEQTGGCSGGV